MNCYREFCKLGQAKFSYSGSILGSSHNATSPAACKNDALFKSGQN